MFNKVLIANRGEIAARLIRTAQKLDIKTVAVYSAVDAHSRILKMATEAYALGGTTSEETYLNIDKLLSIAKESGCDAVHPGYGFLSENPSFARACEAAKVCFIGPPASIIELMGSKQTAKETLINTEIPLIPGYLGKDQDPKRLLAEAENIGFPVMIKAAAGGGGKGMRLVHRPDHFQSALQSCQREAMHSFGNSEVILEKFLSHARHVEVQIFADNFDQIVHLFERDCSLQRRHQKIIEEAPAPHLQNKARERLYELAMAVGRHIHYRNAGTVEFLLDAQDQPYFIEMNTRLQVEHAVTEQITQLDLVEWQFIVAANKPLPKKQEEIHRQGHAFEIRIYAEDPAHNFLPSSGTLKQVLFPDAQPPYVRLESALTVDEPVSVYYDPLLAKLITWGETRVQALRQMQLAIDHVHILGVKTNLNYLRDIVQSSAFGRESVHIDFLAKHESAFLTLHPHTAPPPLAWAIAALGALLHSIKYKQNGFYYHAEPGSPWQSSDAWRMNSMVTHQIRLRHQEQVYEINLKQQEGEYILTLKGELETQGRSLILNAAFATPVILQVLIDERAQFFYFLREKKEIYLHFDHHGYTFEMLEPFEVKPPAEDERKQALVTPMPGIIREILVKIGDKVESGTPLMVIEAMKIEHTIKAHHAGVVQKVFYKIGDLVEADAEVIEIQEGV